MRMSSACRELALVLAGSLGLSAPAMAQAPSELGRLTWEIGAASVGYCVQFLLEPKEALKELKGDQKPVAASAARDLHPAVKRAIADEPKYSEWVPSEFCTWFVDRVAADGKTYQRGDKNAPLAITWWAVAVQQGEGMWDGRYFMRMMGSNSYSLVRAMQVQKLPMEKVQILEHAIKGNDEDRLFFVKFNRATIQFTGQFNADSTGASTPRKVHAMMPGPIQSVWTTDIAYSPQSDGTMSGSLQVFGKRGMAKALNSSPIRFIGPAMMGGTGSAQFIRVSTKGK